MEIIKFKSNRECAEKLSNLLRMGKVIICPTDTVYGLICDATNKKAIKKIFRIKKRPKGKPISIFVKDIKMAKKFAKINKKQEEFVEKVWPGPVTAILEKKERSGGQLFHDCEKERLLQFLGGEKTIGIRIPNYKLIFNLINEINCPLAETSANVSDRPPSTKIKEVLNQFKKEKNHPDLIIDAGDLKPSKPSRVIDLTGKKPKVLRK